MPCLAEEATSADSPRLYARKSTWAETMLAMRAQYLKWRENPRPQAISIGPWYHTAPLAAKGFSDALFPEQKVDLAAKANDGKPIWHKELRWSDGAVHNLPGTGRSSVSTYLFRTMTVPAPMTLRAGFGSDDGLAVWLNGKRILAQDLPRGAGPDQDVLELNLAAGENQLLVKIYNRTGGHAFYFAADNDPATGLWRDVARDFPSEIAWMKRDLPDNAHIGWLKSAADVKLERAMIDRVLNELGITGENLRKQFDALCQGNASPSDHRWLDLYAEACRLHAATARIRAMNLSGLRLAITDLMQSCGQRYARGGEYLARLDALQARIDKADSTELTRLAAEVESLRREAMLSNPLLDFDRLLVVRRNPRQFGMPQNWQGNCSLPRDGYDNEIAILSPVSPAGKLTTLYKPEGGKFVGDVDLNFDADKMLFSMPGSHNRWQIWEIKADGTGLRQVTPGVEPDVNNYDACYRPDGRILYASTLVFQGVPCVAGSDTVANLCVMDADGKNIRQLCFDQDHNWCPVILNDGRVMYTRWEYSDTAHYFTRILFRMNPDGTEQTEYYGSNSYWPNSLFYARPIPNHSSKVVAIVSGHHGVARIGELVILDTAQGRREAEGVVQRIPGAGKKVEPVIEDQLVDNSWPKFLHPYPLNDKYFLVSAQLKPGSAWGIYLVDTFDNMTLIHEVAGDALLEPVPLRKTARPPVIPDRIKPQSRDATVYISDIYFGDGLKGVPRGTIKTLRVSEFHYTYPRMGGHINVGVEGPWDVRRILGTVPVAEDGSVSFKVPANTPICIQPLDAEGKAMQVMRSWFTAMPGETLSCVGCHESQNSVPPAKPAAVMRRPYDITPWFGPARGFSFKREVQPVLNKYCVGCHDGKTGGQHASHIDLSEKPRNGWGNFTPSYLALHPYVRRPGPESDYHLLAPMEFHADTSELFQMLRKGHYNVKLDAAAWDRLATWIDLNVPDHGTWGEHQKIPGDFHARRLAMRTKYANRPEDPELIPEIKREPVQFVQPDPLPENKPQTVECPNWPLSAEDAKRLQAAAGQTTKRTIQLGNGITLNMVLIPAGEFVMGDARGEVDESPLARVKIPKAFWMGTCEITNRQYACFDPAHDSGFIDQHSKDHTTPGYPANRPEQPAIRISWQQAMAYCQWLSETTGARFTLPTEAQWEWACRAGTATPFSYGTLDTDFGPFSNLADISIKLLAVSGVNPQPIANPSQYEDFIPKDGRFNDGARIVNNVGQYQPNAWGLHDMHGNVAEWTRTSYRPYPYRDDDGRNDLSLNSEKVVRGGSWYDRPKRARSAFRLPYRSYQPVYNVGFRVICETE